MPGRRKQALWAGVAVLCYAVAAFVFLTVVAETGLVGSGSATGSIGSAFPPGTRQRGVFVMGGYAMDRARRTRTARPERSALPPQHRSEPRPTESSADPGEKADDGGMIRCADCGGENAADYAFCRRCSAELPA